MAEEPSDSLPAEDTATVVVDEPAAFAPITSQEDFDRRIQDRLKRQKAQFADYDELKTKAAKLEELEFESKTELEKAQARAADLEKQAEAAAAKVKESLLRAAVIAEAAKKHVVDPDGAYAMLDKSSIAYDQDGSPLNVAEAMDALLEDKKYLVPAGGTRGNADQGARRQANTAGQVQRADLHKMTDAEIVQAQAEGRLNDMLTGRS